MINNADCYISCEEGFQWQCWMNGQIALGFTSVIPKTLIFLLLKTAAFFFSTLESRRMITPLYKARDRLIKAPQESKLFAYQTPDIRKVMYLEKNLERYCDEIEITDFIVIIKGFLD